MLFLTFCVILATLVGQGLTPAVADPAPRRRRAGRAGDGEEAHARLAAVEAALRRLEELPTSTRATSS